MVDNDVVRSCSICGEQFSLDAAESALTCACCSFDRRCDCGISPASECVCDNGEPLV